MDESLIRFMAGRALADGGISLPLQTILRKKPFRVTMKVPTSGSFIRISGLVNKIGFSVEEYEKFGEMQHARFIYLHGKEISRIVAYGVVRGFIIGRLLNRPVAWLLRELMTPEALAESWKLILTNTSTTSFGNIIISAAMTDRMLPLVSRNED